MNEIFYNGFLLLLGVILLILTVVIFLLGVCSVGRGFERILMITLSVITFVVAMAVMSHVQILVGP